MGISRTYWRPARGLLGASWEPLGSLSGPLGSLLEALGGLFGSLGGSREPTLGSQMCENCSKTASKNYQKLRWFGKPFWNSLLLICIFFGMPRQAKNVEKLFFYFENQHSGYRTPQHPGAEPRALDSGPPKGAQIEPRTPPDRLQDETTTEFNSERRRGASHEGHKDGYGRRESFLHPHAVTPGRG